ncbi:MAG: hypothetical protein ACLTTH_13650 [Holdemanella porci]
MGRPRTNNVQINIAIPSEWKKNWKTLPESIRLKKVKTITFLDLMRKRYSGKVSVKRCE